MKIPKWLEKDLQYFRCYSCQESMIPECVTGLGIHNHHKNKEQIVFYFQYTCHKCGNMSNVQGQQMGPQQLAKELSGDKNMGLQNRQSQKNKKKKCSLITDQQVCSMKQFLNKQSSYSEVLKYIGLTQQQMKKYSQKDWDGVNEN